MSYRITALVLYCLELISIWFHMGYFEIISHSLEFLYIYMKLTRRKHPDRLANSCKRPSINGMAPGLRLPKFHHGFFLLSSPFQTHFLFLFFVVYFCVVILCPCSVIFVMYVFREAPLYRLCLLVPPCHFDKLDK